MSDSEEADPLPPEPQPPEKLLRRALNELERWRICAAALGRVQQPEDLVVVVHELGDLRERARHVEPLRSSLQTIVTYVRRVGGYMTTEDQMLLRAAQRVLDESEGR